MVRPLRTLLVDDDDEAARWVAAELEGQLGPVVVARDAYLALDRVATETFDAVVTEVALPGASGIELLVRLQGRVPAVVLSWLASPAIVARAQEAGAHAVLGKPCETTRLLSSVRSAVHRAERARAERPVGAGLSSTGVSSRPGGGSGGRRARR